ncbi:MAG: reprolysin-like metallopeptidase [Dokdonella sp.]|uniref:reprolysin-like metallopeptidase n=1 Tax=Dokdonella sp. TaxID=2291710 RepID=UPI003F7E62F3
MNKYSIKAGLLVLGLCTTATAWAGPTEAYWHDDVSRSPAPDAPHPAAFRSLTLDTVGVARHLRSAHESGIATGIALPQPDGGYADFMVVDSGVMPAELQRKYPDILSFKGSDAQGRAVRLDVSPMGFQAMVFDPAGIWVVRPETLGGGTHYLSFSRAELEVPGGIGRCEVHEQGIDPAGRNLVPDTPMTQTGVNRRVYRAAVAANHQYIAAVGGGTVAGGLSATVVAVNRVTQVYETELSISLALVPNNDLLMYASATGDPFGSNGTGVINNSTSVINGVIGAANYDIGHVFTTGSGGVAGLGVVCGGSKARGTTGLPNPTGDAFYIDFVAHEMGHQFGGNHPFNGTGGNCSGGNRNGPTAYEPGSGTTIMAYAGICAADDLQPHSDPYFHAISLQEINNYTNAGGNCSANTTNDNHAPVIDAGSMPSGYTIPARTPFVLSATANDPDAGDTVTYSWEEWDLGPAAALSAGDNGSSPIFRAWPPTVSGARMFPKLSTVLTGTTIKGETLPTTTRALKFRLTARDERPAHGTTQSADVTVNVVNTAGPFQVTTPNTAVSWAQGSTQSVTWDVANTTAAPVSCASVDIALSADGGQTFPYSLASGVANSGSANVTVPDVATTQARVSVACASNVFFDISNANFTIPAAAGTYTVGGNVTGLAGSGLVLQLNGANDLAISVNGSFAFPSALAGGTGYAVTVANPPAHPGQVCTVTNGNGAIGAANVTTIAVACSTPPPPTHTVGGHVAGLVGSGLALKLNGGAALPIAANGPYAFPGALADASVYTVMIASQPSGQTCTLAHANGTVTGADVTNVDVTCTGGGATYTVGGTVGGLTGSGLVLSLNAGAQTAAVASNGPFVFPTALADGSAYIVTIGTQPSGQTCSVANGSGTIAGANVTNVAVSCAATPTFTVGGTVSGLTGGSVGLSLNGGAQSQSVAANGAFTFPGGLVNGATYTVTVATQPATPPQTCVVTNGSGTIAGANVTNVSVTCAGDDRIFVDGFDGSGEAVQPVQDPGFESTTTDGGANPSWESLDGNAGADGGTNFYGDLADFDGLPIHGGHWVTWFGGWEGGAEIQHIAQSVTIPSGAPRYLNFWRLIDSVPDAAGTLTVSIDGNAIDTLDVSSATPDVDFEQRSIDISAYANGAVHVIRFQYQYDDAGGTGIDGNVFIDDVTVDATPSSPRPAPARPQRSTSKAHKHAR